MSSNRRQFPKKFDPTKDIYESLVMEKLFDGKKESDDILKGIYPGDTEEGSKKRRDIKHLTKEQKIAEFTANQKDKNTCEEIKKDGIRINGGVFEVKGLRSELEDEYALDKVPNIFKNLSKEERKEIHLNTFASLQKSIADGYKEDSKRFSDKMENSHSNKYRGGSTAIIPIVWLDKKKGKTIFHASTAYVGDSSAFVVIKHKDGSFSCEKLNKSVHHPNEDLAWRSQHAEVQKDNNYVFNRNKLEGHSLSRAFGDMDYESAGISHKPDIDEIEIELRDGDEVRVISGCDGVLEDLEAGDYTKKIATQDGINQIIKNQEEVIKKIAQENWGTPQEIAYAVGKRAIENLSTDNITALVMTPTEDCVAAKIFDGHKSVLIPKLLKEKSEQVISEEILKIKISPILQGMENNPNIYIKERVKKLEAILKEPDGFSKFYKKIEERAEQSTFKKGLYKMFSKGYSIEEQVFYKIMTDLKKNNFSDLSELDNFSKRVQQAEEKAGKANLPS